MSGCRRITPTALHGASSRIRSNGRPSHHASGRVASPATSARGESKPIEVRADSREPARVAVERPDLVEARAGFQDVTGLAARRRARIEHALARREVEEARRALGRDVLNRRIACREARQRIDGLRRVEHDRGRDFLVRPRADARGLEPCEIVAACRAPLVHAQPHRRGRIVRGADPLPVVGPVVRELLEQPARMAEPRLVVALRARRRARRARAGSGAARRSRAAQRRGARAARPRRPSPTRPRAPESASPGAVAARPRAAHRARAGRASTAS